MSNFELFTLIGIMMIVFYLIHRKVLLDIKSTNEEIKRANGILYLAISLFTLIINCSLKYGMNKPWF